MAIAIRSELAAAILLLISFTAVEGIGGRLGGRNTIQDVKNNKDVQELGKYSVDEYNLGLKGSNGVLKFNEVVEAESQVVAGLKYYLKISASNANGVPETFDAEVVVEPGVRSNPGVKSKQLLNFGPSNPTK